MVKRMLIDATHREETRVAVVSGNRLEEFDFETSTKRPLKGNIYLAKVTRVEPSLQAAFVDYGGNRHGFLAFNEIHPDYYRIPVADRPARSGEADQSAEESETAAKDDGGETARDGDGGRKADGGVETIGGDEMEEIDEMRPARNRPGRRYKIQEVIKKRQILLIQVTKEERGTKGAALTTYLSLAGRYCVLMPNTPRGGGISRKVTNPGDRKRLKAIMEDLKIAEGLAIILRTAGVARSKAEIRRDYDYLLRLWSDIRDATLESTAPSLVYEEGNIIKRAIRDLYTNEITEVLVEGDDGYRGAKDFMKMLIPSHAKRVKRYKEDGMPLFHRYQVESEIDNIHTPSVRLRSGGYIVFDSAEALVAIDVNSGRATRERNIEETAYKTNLEAAEEVARQLRLRDLAGLVVIDFIDMDEPRNNANVERRLKEAMRIDRARIQVGRISAFGLLELSRQRLRPSLLEASTETCQQCGGTGHLRSIESTALHVLRHIEDEGIRRDGGAIEVQVPSEVDLYVLNQKRQSLTEIEQRYGLTVRVHADPTLVRPDMRIVSIATEDDTVAAELPVTSTYVEPEAAQEESEPQERGRGRSRGRRRRPRGEAPPAQAAEAEQTAERSEETEGVVEASEDDTETRTGSKRRRRGKRGGRRRTRRTAPMETSEVETGENAVAAVGADDGAGVAAEAEMAAPPSETAGDMAVPPSDGEDRQEAAVSDDGEAKKPRARRSRRRAKPVEDEASTAKLAEDAEAAPADEAAKPAAKKTRARARKPSTRKRAPKSGNGTGKESAEASSGNGRSEGTKRKSTRARKKPTDATPTETGGAEQGAEALAATDDKPKRGWWRTILE